MAWRKVYRITVPHCYPYFITKIRLTTMEIKKYTKKNGDTAYKLQLADTTNNIRLIACFRVLAFTGIRIGHESTRMDRYS